jgi:hypothetical protein
LYRSYGISHYEMAFSVPFRMATPEEISRRALEFGPDSRRRNALSGALRGGVGEDLAVADVDDAMGVLGDVGFVGDEDDGVAAGVERVKEGHDFVAGFGVEVAGGLVGEDDGGPVDEGAGNGDALALTAGELVGLVVHAIARGRRW